MSENELVIAIIGVVVPCFTGLMVYITHTFFGAKSQHANPGELRELRATNEALTDTVHALQQRIENLEAVVARNEYSAGQRITRAVEERQPLAGR